VIGTVTVPPEVVTDNVPVLVISTVGAKRTGTVTLPPAATEAPAAGNVAENGALGADTAVTVVAVAEVFFNTKFCVDDPATVTSPKSTEAGTATSGEPAPPVGATMTVRIAATLGAPPLSVTVNVTGYVPAPVYV
jgi:hypothetical protein